MRCTSLMTIFMLALGAFAQDSTSAGTDGSLTILPVPTTPTTLPDVTTATDVTSVTSTSVPTVSSTSVPPVSSTSVPKVSSRSTTTAPTSSATTTAPTTSLVTSFSRTPFSTVAATTVIAPPLPNAAFRLALSIEGMALGGIAGITAFLLF